MTGDSRNTRVNAMTRAWAGRVRNSLLDSGQVQHIFLFTKASKPALRRIEPPIQWTKGLLLRCEAASARS